MFELVNLYMDFCHARLLFIMSQEELKQRALKITEALYRTTDLFSDAEPLKWSLRQTALDILNLRKHDFLGFEESVKNISLKLDLAASGTFISKTNFDVLKRAYTELLSNTISLREDYESLFLSDKLVGVVSDTVSDKRLENSGRNQPPLNPPPLNNGGRGGVGSLTVAVQAVSAVAQPFTLNDRRTTLLSALKQKSPIGVGDLTRALSESGVAVSEKTVQRELAGLVASGAIKQEGDKRWRRYFV